MPRSRTRIPALLLALLCGSAALAPAISLEVENRYGGVSITVVDGTRLEVNAANSDRPMTAADARITRAGDRVFVSAQPKDRGPLDLKIQLPLGFGLDARTVNGPIEVEGMIHRARLETETGDIHLKVPWPGTRMTLDADVEPSKLVLPEDQKFLKSTIDIGGGRTLFRLRDALPERAIVYGDYRIKTARPESVVLEKFVPPDDWPLRFPWEAQDVLDRLLDPRARPQPRPAPQAPDEPPVAEGEQPLFRSDVRLVNFILAVNDGQGRPVTDLEASDFSVFEDGERQTVASAGSDNVPFNLAILLDLSGSAKPDAGPMKAAARGFVEIAQRNDRIALYALSGGMFQVVSRLTSNHFELLNRIERLPPVTGPSPLYDVITLAYAEELQERPGERNALIVISDGIDNQVSKQEAPSSIKFKHLRKAAQEMNAIIYPIFLRSGERFGRGWSEKARERMQDLADASGGVLFPAASIEDMEPVFPLVEAELRSVYSVAYYPKNQIFDGEWRKVEVRIDRPNVTVRARPGYYAQ